MTDNKPSIFSLFTVDDTLGPTLVVSLRNVLQTMDHRMSSLSLHFWTLLGILCTSAFLFSTLFSASSDLYILGGDYLTCIPRHSANGWLSVAFPFYKILLIILNSFTTILVEQDVTHER